MSEDAVRIAADAAARARYEAEQAAAHAWAEAQRLAAEAAERARLGGAR